QYCDRGASGLRNLRLHRSRVSSPVGSPVRPLENYTRGTTLDVRAMLAAHVRPAARWFPWTVCINVVGRCFNLTYETDTPHSHCPAHAHSMFHRRYRPSQ